MFCFLVGLCLTAGAGACSIAGAGNDCIAGAGASGVTIVGTSSDPGSGSIFFGARQTLSVSAGPPTLTCVFGLGFGNNFGDGFGNYSL